VTLAATDSLPLHLAWFENQGNRGEPALGDPETTSWGNFTSIFEWRREGGKDGPNFIPGRLKLEPDGRQVRRLKGHLLARTAVALDIETSKKSGEVPPSPNEAIERAKALDLTMLLYTSHNHKPGDPRYRLVFPLSAEMVPELPAPEIMAEHMGLLGVLDRSKIGAQSLFYLPSCPYGALDLHQTVVTLGAPIDAGWIVERAGALMAARQIEADRIAAEAQAEAAARRETKIAAGFDPDDSLIERLRSRFDLGSILTGHGYDKAGTKYRHPNSQSGGFGADIKTLGGIERVFSHNGTDPLHAANLPAWCGGVTALDVFDVVAILDFAGDRTRALRDLAERFNLTKAAERKALAGLLFRMMRQQVSQAEIEAAAFAEGVRTGLSRDEVIRVAVWVASQPIATREAA
jgi:hypothetical protein